MERPPSSCTWLLKPIEIMRLQNSIEITAEGVTLGRSEASSVVIPESGFPFVSSSHARVRLAGDAPEVEDLGSRNGTLVNGEKVERATLRNGDILQLGQMGPRFAVVCADRLNDTLPTVAVPQSGATRELTQSGMVKIRKALGIPRDADLSSYLEHRTRRGRRVLWAGLAIVALGAAIALWILNERSRAEAERLRSLKQELEERLAQTSAQVTRQEAAWKTERERLLEESAALAAKIGSLEHEAGASAGRLAELRQELAETHKQLELYDPVNIELGRLREVKRVARTVVFIEAATRFRHRESGVLLYALPDGEGIELNLREEGEPFELESSGSGFCVAREGWILTNAHVVLPDRQHGLFARRFGADFEAHVTLRVVFSGSSVRHPAQQVDVVLEDEVDLALLKIEPFDGMPYLEDLDLDLPVPETGTEVYLSGFPLGTTALQQGETVIASTFKGILSRVVPPFLQVDAAVHPGNSGGPVMDTRGRILGIATRVQKTPGGPYASSIGYITPIAAVKRIWPPRSRENGPK